MFRERMVMQVKRPRASPGAFDVEQVVRRRIEAMTLTVSRAWSLKPVVPVATRKSL